MIADVIWLVMTISYLCIDDKLTYAYSRINGWTIVTSMFVHLNHWHFYVNATGVIMIGRLVELIFAEGWLFIAASLWVHCMSAAISNEYYKQPIAGISLVLFFWAGVLCCFRWGVPVSLALCILIPIESKLIVVDVKTCVIGHVYGWVCGLLYYLCCATPEMMEKASRIFAAENEWTWEYPLTPNHSWVQVVEFTITCIIFSKKL